MNSIVRSEQSEADKLHSPLLICSGDIVHEMVKPSTSEEGGIPFSNRGTVALLKHTHKSPLSVTEKGLSTGENRMLGMIPTHGNLAGSKKENCHNTLAIRLHLTSPSSEDLGEPAAGRTAHSTAAAPQINDLGDFAFTPSGLSDVDGPMLVNPSILTYFPPYAGIDVVDLQEKIGVDTKTDFNQNDDIEMLKVESTIASHHAHLVHNMTKQAPELLQEVKERSRSLERDLERLARTAGSDREVELVDGRTPTEDTKKKVRFSDQSTFMMIRRRKSVPPIERQRDRRSPPKHLPVPPPNGLSQARFSGEGRDNRPAMPLRRDTSFNETDSVKTSAVLPIAFLRSINVNRRSPTNGTPTVPTGRLSNDVFMSSPATPGIDHTTPNVKDKSPVASLTVDGDCRRPKIIRHHSHSSVETRSFGPLTPTPCVSGSIETFLARARSATTKEKLAVEREYFKQNPPTQSAS